MPRIVEFKAYPFQDQWVAMVRFEDDSFASCVRTTGVDALLALCNLTRDTENDGAVFEAVKTYLFAPENFDVLREQLDFADRALGNPIVMLEFDSRRKQRREWQ